MFMENGIEIPEQIAGLLCAAIISDTLMFRSPTCTPMDENACRALAKIAKVDIEKLASDMFKAGSNLNNRSFEEIFEQDYKEFNSEDFSFGIGQISAFDKETLKNIKDGIKEYMENIYKEKDADILCFMLTNIFEESTELLYYGKDAEQLLAKAFKLEEVSGGSILLPDVVSRKKQVIPKIMSASNQE